MSKPSPSMVGSGLKMIVVVLLVEVGVDLDDDALDESRQVLREQAGEDAATSGLDVLLPALGDDLPTAFGVGAFEMPGEESSPGQGEVTRGVGGVFQRRDGLMLGFSSSKASSATIKRKSCRKPR